MNRARHWATLLLAAGLALALASGLAACGGAADGDPPPTEALPATPEPPAAPVEATATAEPPVPEASTPTAEPASTAPATPEPTAAPIDSPTGEPPAAPDEAEALPLLYDTYDRSGAVAEPGHYVFLADPADPSTAITTYEGLRTGLRDGTPIGLLIHQHDSAGTSQAAFYDLVEVNDVVEWREADNCWMRYVVTAVHPDPTGTPPRKLLTLRVYSHAYSGCSGTISATGSRAFSWSPVQLETGDIAVPIWHGSDLLVPEGWTGSLPDRSPTTLLVSNWPPDPLPDPDLGSDWTGGVVDVVEYGGLMGLYSHTDGGFLDVFIYPARVWPLAISFFLSDRDDRATADILHEFRIIDGWPAVVSYARVRDDTAYANVTIYDQASGVFYAIHGGTVAQRNDPEALIELALQFLPDAPVASAASPPPAEPAISASEPAAASGAPSPPTAESPAPEPAPQSFLYDTYDLSGAVAEPGHYAFLADAADPASVVTTYEGLRDGTATALLIHTHDAHGVSQAAFYDAVETGDLVEWKQADDCFVRYTVTGAPAPAAGAVTRAFGVAWMTYAFTGCSGAISTASGSTDSSTPATVDVTWGAVLPALGGESLAAPVRHGPFQIVPDGWTGATEAVTWHDPPAHNRDNPRYTTDPATARTYPYWREPDLPDQWVLSSASTDPETVGYGYRAAWRPEPWDGFGLLEISGAFFFGRGGIREAYWDEPGRIPGGYETRVIAGRPAQIRQGQSPFLGVKITIYDPATGAGYEIVTSHPSFRGENLDALIDLARSLFESPNAP